MVRFPTAFITYCLLVLNSVASSVPNVNRCSYPVPCSLHLGNSELCLPWALLAYCNGYA